jgi:hypothetical protein
MSASQELERFNAYDIFSTLLPGFAVLFGVSIPHPRVYNNIGEIPLSSLALGLILAFTLGLFVQGIAGIVLSGEKSFRNRMKKVVTEGLDDDAVSEFDVYFLERAREKFNLDVEFNDWGYLYRTVLTELEQNPSSRAIRLQSLFLAMRGLCVGTAILFVTTLGYLISAADGRLSPEWPIRIFVVINMLLLVLCLVAYVRALEFRRDVVSYMITEFRASDTQQTH